MAVKRRQGCPQTVLHMWDAVAYIRQQKQIPNFERLSAYMKRVYNLNSSDLERQLNFAVLDELIVVKKTVGCKGAKVGIEQDGYRVPDELQGKDDHDWYCFECHRGGEVILCTTCHRVFHEVCIKEKSSSGNFVCSVCKQSDRFASALNKVELNKLLGYTCIRLKEKTRELHRIPHPDEEKWRYDFIIFEPMDLIAMEEKMKANKYTKLEEFFNDAQQIVHNVIVYFGIHSLIADMARQMLIDCEYDLNEIIQCCDCYRMSNIKNNKYWFCQPCHPPHELVYAKIRGFPYWPAKVIRKTDSSYDVRFFGAFHQRALVQEDFVKPVSTSFKKLGIKLTASFKRAYEELQHHQKLVEKSLNGQATNEKTSNEPFSEDSKLESDSTQDSFSSTKSKSQPTRKRKATTPLPKAPNPKRTTSVPLKKNKKFYQESPTSSSPKDLSFQEVSTPEDHNVVTSSSQETSVLSSVSVGIQTPKELLINVVNVPEKKEEKASKSESQKVNADKPCDCSTNNEKMLSDLRSSLEIDHKDDKNNALNELTEKLKKEMESEKQKAVASALEKHEQEQKESYKKAEEQRKAVHLQEMQKINEQHKQEISETKKKQWCYNCEIEAIYHCCWNTSYCSVECQQLHWHKEHKRTCRRKR